MTKTMRDSKHQPEKKIEADQFRKSRREDTEEEERENKPVIFRGRLAVDSGSGDSAEVPQTHSCNIAKTGPDIAL